MSRSGIIGSAGSSNTPSGSNTSSRECIFSSTAAGDNYGTITFYPQEECNGDFPVIRCYSDRLKGRQGTIINNYLPSLKDTVQACITKCAKKVSENFWEEASLLTKIHVYQGIFNDVENSGIVFIEANAFKKAGSPRGFFMELDKCEIIGAEAFKESTFQGPNFYEGIDYDDKSLGRVDITSKLLYLGNCAFSKCEKIKKVTIPSNLTNNIVFNDAPPNDDPNPPPPPNGVKCASVTYSGSEIDTEDVELYLVSPVTVEALTQEGILPLTYLKDVEGEEVETNIDSWTVHSGEGNCGAPYFKTVSVFTPYDIDGIPVQLDYIQGGYPATGSYVFVIEGAEVIDFTDDTTTTERVWDFEGESVSGWSISVSDTSCTLKNPDAPKIEQGWQDSTFESCISLHTAEFGEDVRYIPDRSFFECVKLKNLGSLFIPRSVNNIGVESFRGCTSLVNVVIEGRPKSIGYAAFFDCNIINLSIDGEEYNPNPLPEGVSQPEPTSVSTTIEKEAFWNNDITGITLNKVGEIGANAFENAIVADVNFDSSVPLNIGFKAFANNTFLGGQTTIHATTIAAGAFSDVNWLQSIN